MRRAVWLALALCAGVTRAFQHEEQAVAKTRESEIAKVARLEHLVRSRREEILAVYSNGPDKAQKEHLTDGVSYFAPKSRGKIVERLLRALVLGDSFVIAVGGMSDVVAHGNMFEESYPMVARDMLMPVMSAAGIKFDIRNMAMGGVPSYPNSVCMRDNFGADADVVAWDFRMVETSNAAGNEYQELYVRQAMLMPRAPFIQFKRPMPVLKGLTYAFEEAALSVVNELVALKGGAADLLERTFADDKFCEKECTCPGQVKWHATWKKQRFRGHHLALHYLDLFEEAVGQYGALLGDGATPGQGHLVPDDPRWVIKPRTTLPPATPGGKGGNKLHLPFASTAFRCAMTWTPHVGPALADLVDPQLGMNGWTLKEPNPRINANDIRRHKACNYPDDRASLYGDASSDWVHFKVPNVKAGGMIAFCGDFKSFEFASYASITMNEKDVVGDLQAWLTSQTLGIQAACFSTTANVVAGTNVLGFRITASEPSGTFGRRGGKAAPYMFLTHVVWEEA